MPNEKNLFDPNSSSQALPATPPVTWTASEYIDHKQGPVWFLGLIGVTVVLAGIIYFLSNDYFATAITLVLGLTVGLFARRTPRQLHYELSSTGLKIEQKVYPFELFKSFSLIADGILTSLDFTPIKKFMPTVSVYFDPSMQEQIVRVLEHHLPYEEKQLDGVDQLMRRIRL